MTKHHEWCSAKDAPRSGCLQCEELFARYPTAELPAKPPRKRREKATAPLPDNRWRDFLERARLGGSAKARASIARILLEEFGELNEIVGGDELCPSETTWYFTANKPTATTAAT